MSRRGEIITDRTSRGYRYELEIFHDKLNKNQVIKGNDKGIVEKTAHAKMALWDDIWENRSSDEKQIQNAKDRTVEAQQSLDILRTILKHALEIEHIDPILNKSLPKRVIKYPIPKPIPKISELKTPILPKLSSEPSREWPQFLVKYGIVDKFSQSRRDKKKQEMEDAFNEAHSKWEAKRDKILETYQKKIKLFEVKKQEQQEEESKYLKAVEEWEHNRSEYFNDINRKRDKKKAIVINKSLDNSSDKKEITKYFSKILRNSKYPKYFPKSYEFYYNPDNKLVVLDYQLPSLKVIPTLKEVHYVQSTKKVVENHITVPQLNNLYDNLLYQISLRTIYELFKADEVKAISSIVFNGYVKSASTTTGQEINPCVLTLQVSKTEFKQINLANVEPKACFKQLKGVGSSKLFSMTPIAPLMKMNRTDKRFISPYGVENRLNEAVNLALIEWEDFEQLVRELFEQEYSGPGNDVKVTRASRDYGVDAVAFDSDPVRGGKIVIQAKRYTNVVGVSAVRDLYGTVLNEGAMKGILITTADYGPESYEFAKGKPLTLLNGNNLLFLLEKHGHKAKIDLKEAKEILAKEKSQSNNHMY